VYLVKFGMRFSFLLQPITKQSLRIFAEFDALDKIRRKFKFCQRIDQQHLGETITIYFFFNIFSYRVARAARFLTFSSKEYNQVCSGV